MDKMKKLLMAVALILGIGMSADFAEAGTYKEGTITIGASMTNLTESVMLGKGEDFGFIDRVVGYNATDAGTGVVSFALFDCGAKGSVIAQSGSLVYGTLYTNSPRYLVSNATETNMMEYSAKRLLVTVYQTATNRTPTTYRWGIYSH